MASQWVKCIIPESHIRAVGIQATDLVQSLVDRHKISGLEAQVLGEGVIGALGIASLCKDGERVNLSIRSTGPFRQVFVDATSEGHIRGYGIKPEHQLDASELEARGPWGEGLMSVLRSRNSSAQPYVGTVPLLTGFFAKDMTYYWAQSEQIPSAIGIEVRVSKSDPKRVELAYGFIIQALPGCADSEIQEIENSLARLPGFLKKLDAESPAVHAISQVFSERPFSVLLEQEIIHQCSCSVERVEGALRLLGFDELNSLVEEGKPALVRCDFCTHEYAVEVSDLRRLATEIASS